MNKEELKARNLCSIVNEAHDKVFNISCCFCSKDSQECQEWRFYLIEDSKSLWFRFKFFIKGIEQPKIKKYMFTWSHFKGVISNRIMYYFWKSITLIPRFYCWVRKIDYYERLGYND